MKYVEIEPREVYICFGKGKKYGHQCAGCGCFQRTVQNPILLGKSNSKFFLPSWWYSFHYFGDGCAMSKPGFVVPDFKMPYNSLSLAIDNKDIDVSDLEKIWEAERVIAEFHPRKLTFEELRVMFIKEVSKINHDCTDFAITGEFLEAYVEVSFNLKGNPKSGVIIWENCD